MSLLLKLGLLKIDDLTDTAYARFIEDIQNRRTAARAAARIARRGGKPKPTVVSTKAKRAKKKATKKLEVKRGTRKARKESNLPKVPSGAV